MNDLLRRQRALTQTTARFREKRFAWGVADCVKLAVSHMRVMGHVAPRVPRYRSAIGARRALAATGYRSLEALLDDRVPRIPSAAMLPGDLVMMEGEPPFDALTICMGRKLLGWHEDAETPVIIVPIAVKAAWRL